MPVKVRKRYASEGGKEWKIVEADNPGHVKGESDTKGKAEASARARNAAIHNKGKK